MLVAALVELFNAVNCPNAMKVGMLPHDARWREGDGDAPAHQHQLEGESRIRSRPSARALAKDGDLAGTGTWELVAQIDAGAHASLREGYDSGGYAYRGIANFPTVGRDRRGSHFSRTHNDRSKDMSQSDDHERHHIDEHEDDDGL